jgi:hypothetical protein
MEGASPSKALAAKAISPTVALNGSDSGKENEEVTGRDTRKVQSTAAASPLTTEGNQEAEGVKRPTRFLDTASELTNSTAPPSPSHPRPAQPRQPNLLFRVKPASRGQTQGRVSG